MNPAGIPWKPCGNRIACSSWLAGHRPQAPEQIRAALPLQDGPLPGLPVRAQAGPLLWILPRAGRALVTTILGFRGDGHRVCTDGTHRKSYLCRHEHIRGAHYHENMCLVCRFDRPLARLEHEEIAAEVALLPGTGATNRPKLQQPPIGSCDRASGYANRCIVCPNSTDDIMLLSSTAHLIVLLAHS